MNRAREQGDEADGPDRSSPTLAAPARAEKAAPGWRRVTPWLVFGAFVAATLARGTGEFYWDADHYWQATQAIVGTTPDVPPGYWELRGFWSALLFTPAAAAVRVLGAEHAPLAVLLQNSVVFGAVAVALLPALLSRWQRPTIGQLWLIGILFWLVTSGFAPFPLIDVYAVIGVLSLFLLLPSRRPWPLLAAGLVGGVVINIRPAYLVVLALVALVVFVWRRWRGLLFASGILIALIPQLLLNLVTSGRWSLVPGGSGDLVALQAGYASYVVRYDSMIGAANARQFFCSPEMAALIGDAVPATGGQLAWSFLAHMPPSIQFGLEKVAASLDWQLSIPYAVTMRPIDTLFGLGVQVMTVAGITAVLYAATRRRGTPPLRDWYGAALVIAVVAGAVLTLVGSATESRFALVLVVLGALGVALLARPRLWTQWRLATWWILAAVLLTSLTLVFAHTGSDDPAPRGDVTPAVCAET